MELKLDQGQMRIMVTKAIFDSMTPEAREKMVSDAISSCLKVADGYGGKSTLQRSFDDAIRAACSQVAHDMIGKDEKIKAELEKLYVEAWKRLMSLNDDGDGGREKLISRLSSAMGEALTGSRY